LKGRGTRVSPSIRVSVAISNPERNNSAGQDAEEKEDVGRKGERRGCKERRRKERGRKREDMI
jgi:hypothetical protein